MNANETVVSLPKTWAAIKSDFPGKDNKALRDAIYSECQHNGFANCQTIALNASGKASLAAVNEISRAEFGGLGFDRVYVGEGDPSVYGPGAVVAYLDQPAAAH